MVNEPLTRACYTQPSLSYPKAPVSLWFLLPDKRQMLCFWHQTTSIAEPKCTQSASTPTLTYPYAPYSPWAPTKWSGRSSWEPFIQWRSWRDTQSCHKPTNPLLLPPHPPFCQEITTFKNSAILKIDQTKTLTKFFMRAMGRHRCTHIRTMERLESNLHIL